MVELHLHSPIRLHGVVLKRGLHTYYLYLATKIPSTALGHLKTGIVSSYTARGMDANCSAIQYCIQKDPLSNLGPRSTILESLLYSCIVSSGNFWDKTVMTPSFHILPNSSFRNYPIS
jgi:hypothetical protein